MAISSALCASFKLELLQAIHDFTTDTFMMALYDASTASLDGTTTAYTATGEVAGVGYAPGGVAVAVSTGWPALFGQAFAGCRFEDAVWMPSSIAADGALVYNASKANRAVAVLAFPARRTSITNTFRVRFPPSLDPIVSLK